MYDSEQIRVCMVVNEFDKGRGYRFQSVMHSRLYIDLSSKNCTMATSKAAK